MTMKKSSFPPIALLLLAVSGCGGGPSRVSTFEVRGMDCSACEDTVEAKIAKLPGVSEVEASRDPGKAVVTYDPERVRPEAIVAAVKEAGYEAVPPEK